MTLSNSDLDQRFFKPAPFFSTRGFFGASDPGAHVDISNEIAIRYEARGQVDKAIGLWGPTDAACQAIVKSPAATDADLQAFHRRRATGFSRRLIKPWRTGNAVPRVGYHCSFMDAPTITAQMQQVFEHHEFEVVLYCASKLSDREFRRMVIGDKIDVLVELSGFSPGNRFGAMSLRCAPVQVSYLNHPASSQVPNVDWILADEIALPRDWMWGNAKRQAYYSESVWRLPGCFFCYDYGEDAFPPIRDLNLRGERPLTFGCFGAGGKINAHLIGLWAKLLKAAPEARFRLQNNELRAYDVRRHIAEQFGTHGIARDRLDLIPGCPRNELLDAYNHVDVSLDTWPYCGGNTIAESLWMGVPVITLKGDRFASAYGASLVLAAGHPEWIANTEDEYVHKALQARPTRKRMKVGDSKELARNLEEAYRGMLAHVR